MSKYEFWNSNDYNPKELKEELFKTLRHTRLNNGVSYASIGRHYINKCWIRDMVNCSLPELEENPELYKQTYHAMLDFYISEEDDYGKFTSLINNPHNKADYEYPHPRCTKELKEIPDPWGFIQLDAIGLFLYGVYLGQSMKIQIIRDGRDREVINLIIKMLESVKYYNVPDHGCWEEAKKIETSSIGAVLAGLSAIRLLGFKVNQYLLDEAHNRLNELLPSESNNRDVDMAQLSLIYPLNIVDPFRARQIIANVEAKLLRSNGVIRYENDMYYNQTKKKGDEPAWCFGLSYLSLAYSALGDTEKARYYARLVLDRTILKGVKMPYINKITGIPVDDIFVTSNAAVPEMFVGDEPNDNTPLAWSNAFAILALRESKLI